MTAVTPSLTVSETSVDLGFTATGTAGTPETYDVSGKNLTANVILTAPTDVELSSNSGTNWSTTLTLTPTTGTLASTAVEARIQAAAPVGSISGSITNASTGATTEDVTVSGKVNPTAPTIDLSATTLNLGTAVTGTAGTPEDYNIGGTNLTANVVITAPTGVELSSNSGTSWSTTLTLSPTSGSLASTQIDARIQAAASIGSISGSITNVSTGATTQDITVTGLVNPTTPTMDVSPSILNLGTVVTGTASTPQDYTIGGTSLTNNIVITAPTGVQISDNSGAAWSTTLTLTPTSGTVDSTTVEVRISAAASVGPISGSITNVSTGTTTENVSISGIVNPTTPTLNVSSTSLALGTVVTGTAGTPQDYNIGGTSLTANIVITAPTGVELSDNSGTSWSTTLTLTPSSGTVTPTTVEARIQAAASVGSITGSITNVSTGATTQDVTVSGTVNAVPPTVSVSTSSLNLGTTVTGTAGTPADYTVSGVSLTNNVVITAPTGVELSDNSGTSWSPTLTLTPASGTVAATTVEARLTASAPVGTGTETITNASTGATTEDVSVTGTVNPTTPTLNVSTDTLNLGTAITGTAGTPQDYTIGGTTLTNSIVITAPTGVELSDNGGTAWSANPNSHPHQWNGR